MLTTDVAMLDVFGGGDDAERESWKSVSGDMFDAVPNPLYGGRCRCTALVFIATTLPRPGISSPGTVLPTLLLAMLAPKLALRCSINGCCGCG